MKTMNTNSKTLFKNYSLRSRRMAYNRKVSIPSDDEESDSEEDERERRKYLSLRGGELFWSANRLNKNFMPHNKDFLEMNCNYLADRTASMSSFKRNIQMRHSLKHFRRRPLANISDVELYDNFDKNLELSQRALLRKSITLDDIEMNDNLEYGFNPQRVSGSKANIQVRLRPMSLCIPPKHERVNQSESFMLSRRSLHLRKVTSYATNKNEVKLERELINLRSQSCSLNFQGCEGNLNKEELKESISMLRRQRFVCRKLNFDYHPNKWKKTVSLDSGLATENILSKLDVSKSEERLQRKRSRKKLLSVRKKSVEFLDVHNEADNVNVHEENELTISSESDEVTDRVVSLETNEQEEVSNAASASTELEIISSANTNISPTHTEHTPTEQSEHEHSDTTLSPVDEALTTESTPSDSVSSDTSNEKLDMTKSSERMKRLKSGIPQLFSSFRLPSRSTFRKLLIRRKTTESTTPDSTTPTPTPLKASHDIIGIQLFKNKSDTELYENIRSNDDSTESTTAIQILHDKETATIENNDFDIVTAHNDVKVVSSKVQKEEKIVIMVGGDTGSLGDLQSVSLDSLNSYEKATMRNSNKLIDKSVSAYSLPRVDEDKEFSSSLERRSKSSCSISLTKPKGQHHHLRHDGSRVRHMSECDLATYDERPTGCSPGKRLMRRILSPVVCGFPPPPDKYGQLNDSMHSLNSYDSGSIASDCEQVQLFDFSSQELVEEMTLIDKELLARIPWEELSVLGWMSPDKFLLAPNVMKMVQFFNRIAMLVTSNVLNEESTYRRAKVIKKAIKLAFKCRLAKNFNSLKAVLGGLQCTPVFRLKATWKEVPSKYRKTFRELSELMSEENNFANYRKALNVAILEPPCMPFLGNFLTEVAHTHAFQAIHAKYRATSLLAQKQRESWTSDVIKNKSAGNQHVNTPNGNDDDEDGTLNQNSDLNSEHPCILANTHSRTDSESSNIASCDCPHLRHPHLLSNTHSRTDSECSNTALLPELTRCTSACTNTTNDFTHPDTHTHSRSDTNTKTHSRSDSEHSNPDLCLDYTDQENLFECTNKELLNDSSCIDCKTHSRTDSEISNSDILHTLRNGHTRTHSEISNQELMPDPTHTNNKIHSRTDSDDSGVVLNTTNKRYSNYIEELESPRERCLAFPEGEHRTTDDDILQNRSLNDKLTRMSIVVDNNTKNSITRKNDKLSECENMFGKLQLYGMAYDYVSRPYIRHILVNSAFNTEEVSYKLSLKREPPKR